jgi:outer membrane protein
MTLSTKAGAFSALLMVSTLASAQSPAAGPWSVRAGPAHIQFHTQSEVSLGGIVIPGAGVQASSSTALAFDIGYDLSPNLAARLTLGLPPTTRITGTGTIAPVGELGRLKYGPSVVSLTWAFGAPGTVRPYVGAGINYTAILESRDGALSGLDARNAFGAVLQAGVEIPIDAHWGLFVDLKKVHVKTSATGAAGAAPARASIRLDPLVTQAGIAYRF